MVETVYQWRAVGMEQTVQPLLSLFQGGENVDSMGRMQGDRGIRPE